MAVFSFFNEIWTGLQTYLGFTWVAYALIGLLLFFLCISALKMDVPLALVFGSTPLVIFVTQSLLFVSWGLAIVVLVLGTILGLSILKLVRA